MESEERTDVFTQGFEDEAGGVICDQREAEPLPGEEIPQQAPEEADADRSREILRFTQTYPEVRASDVPDEVWNRVRDGEKLTEAYTRYEADILRQENARLRAENDIRQRERVNRERSAGSMSGSGGPVRDAFDEGWDTLL